MRNHGEPVRGELIVDERPNAPKLADLLAKFFLLRTSVSNEKTRDHYRRSIQYLGEMLGRPPTVDDLDDEILAALMNYLRTERQQIPATVNTTHKFLTSFWRWCRDRGHLNRGPTVKPLVVPKRTPRAMTHDEFAKLVRASQTLKGSIGGLPAPVWWLTVLQLVVNTGVRCGELFEMRWEWLDWKTGWLRVPAECRKGRREDMTYALWKDTLDHLRPLAKPEGPIIPWAYNSSRFFQLWDRLLEAAGLPRTRTMKTQSLRRLFATAIDTNGGDASRALGHASPDMARKHYIDPTARPAQSEADVIPSDLRPVALLGRASR